MNRAPWVALMGSSPRPWSPRLEAFIAIINEKHCHEIALNDRAMVMLDATTPFLTAPGRSGVLIGHLFDRATSARVTSVTDEDLGTTPIDAFVERYWGGYVAIRARSDDGCEIWRDPSGDIPCYCARIDGVQIATARPAWLFDHGLLLPEIDWSVVGQSLVYRDFRPQRTALRGLAELLPGTALTVHGEKAETATIWSPWRFVDEQQEIRDFAEAAEILRITASSCIGAWAHCFENPIIEISGGLDSAIVAAGVSLTGTRPGCLTFGPTQGDPDELPYARAIADHLGLELRVETLKSASVDLMLSDAADLPRPCARNFSQALDRLLAQAGREASADAWFSGGGGDSLFGHLQSATAAVDRYHREGMGRSLLRTVDDLARLGRVTIWQAAAAVARRARRGSRLMPSIDGNRFIDQSVQHDLPWPDHPWLQADPQALPGKRTHVWAMVGIYNYMEGFGRLDERPVISPLMSQPLFELCMRIPTWLWCEGGINRAAARKAFETVLPRPVLARATKGAFDGFGAAIIDQNRVMLRAMLLDGVLAREGLIDVVAVQRALESPLPDGTTIVDILTLADAEAWTRAWESR